MRQRGIGFNELDAKMGKDGTGYTSRMLSEKREPHGRTVRALAKALGVSPGWLLGLDEGGPK